MDTKERFNATVSKATTRPGLVTVACVLVLLSACGNKGPLYLEVDEKTILEIDELQREIDEAEEEARKAREREAAGVNININE